MRIGKSIGGKGNSMCGDTGTPEDVAGQRNVKIFSEAEIGKAAFALKGLMNRELGSSGSKEPLKGFKEECDLVQFVSSREYSGNRGKRLQG